MDKLTEYSASRIHQVDPGFKRYLWEKINWNNRLIAITGARGVGKTTLLLQHIREHLYHDPDEVLFVSMDDLFFTKTGLVEFADAFVKRGGKYLFLDEIHKYPNWSREVKNAYDYFSDLQIVITGSSALDIYKGAGDLSRRAVLYQMQGMSFREFIAYKYQHKFPVISLEELLANPAKFTGPVLQKIKPIKLFEEYLAYGYYPFFIEDEETYHGRLRQTVNHVLETDLPSTEKIDYHAVHQLRRLLAVIAELVPFKPNIMKLSQQLDLSRETLLKYLYLLDRAGLLLLLQANTQGTSRMNKPEKVYLENTNLLFALADSEVQAGTMREIFLFNQLAEANPVSYSGQGDFFVRNKYTIEAGGKHKTRKQIAGIPDAYVAADHIEHAWQNKIPLWLFGFLY
ncbi:MAG: ATP-binding protein [Bacteroidales bacterium]